MALRWGEETSPYLFAQHSGFVVAMREHPNPEDRQSYDHNPSCHVLKKLRLSPHKSVCGTGDSVEAAEPGVPQAWLPPAKSWLQRSLVSSMTRRGLGRHIFSAACLERQNLRSHSLQTGNEDGG